MDYYKLQELPQTYKRCKQHTENFEQWFIETARKRKIELAAYHVDTSNSNAQPTKGRRKKHKIPVSAFVPIAREIVNSGVPLDDDSGINDLSDAIRTRKEVTAWHRIHHKSDKGHPFFIGVLSQAKDILSGGRSNTNDAPHVSTNNHKEHDLPDETPFFFTIECLATLSGEDDQPEYSKEFDVPSAAFEKDNHKRKAHAPKVEPKTALSAEEMGLEQEFQLLCFVYDYNQIKEFVLQVWRTYRDGRLGLVTAALVTDLALAIIRRNVAAMVQDLEDYQTERSLADILTDLYEKLVASEESTLPTEEPAKTEAAQETRRRIGNRFCIYSLLHLAELYQRVAHQKETAPDFLHYMDFLTFFSGLVKQNLQPPVLDNFTQGMLSCPDGSQPWLLFGLHIVIEIQVTIYDIPKKVFEDSVPSILNYVRLMQAHITYEDQMWDAGTRPDYMSAGETKFSNVFLDPCRDILSWMGRIFDDQKEVSTKKGRVDENTSPERLSALHFMAIHPTLGGLAAYHINRIYQTYSIGKTQWFVVAICHLYNACRQVGGLGISWPDLDYIIEMQGVKRIFVGDPPTDPQFFKDRLHYAMGRSTKASRQEYLQRHRQWKYWAHADKETKKRRGLQSLLPLQDKIREYYYEFELNERWKKLQNLFAYLYHSETPIADDSLSRIIEELQPTFDAMPQTLLSAAPEGLGKPKVKIPKFSPEPYVYTELLSKMQTQLQETEVHSNFDYLSFYRRTYAFVLEIRDVLYDQQKEFEKLDTQEADPSNVGLLVRLFDSLQIQDKSKDIQVQGDEVSKDVVALGKLQTISKMLEDFIKKQGRAELDNAERLAGRCSDLNTTYPQPEPAQCTDPPIIPEPLVCLEPPLCPVTSAIPGPLPSNSTSPVPGPSTRLPAASSHHVVIDGRPGKLFHRFTYSSTASRRVRVTLYMGRSPGSLQLACRKERRSFFRGLDSHPQLVGKKKHSITFSCLGACCLGMAARGEPMDPVAVLDRWARAMRKKGHWTPW